MRIVVYNHSDQFALSRHQVETLKALMPSSYWAKVREFNLCEDSRNVEVFEYVEKTKVVFFSYPVKEKSPEVVERAVRELLLGLARVRANSEFFLPVRAHERESYSEFIEEWLPKCLAAVIKK